MFIEKLVVARLSRPDAADLVTAEDSGVDVAALREEATAIRVNLEEMASDRALGKITRAQMLKATEAGTARLDQIGAELDTAARENGAGPAGRGRERRRRVGWGSRNGLISLRSVDNVRCGQPSGSAQ
jgi:hypothetical protein